jgi:terminase small subunit / prophage DNA-packing protein
MVKTQETKKPLSHWLNRKNMAASLGISTQAYDNWNVTPAAKIGRESFFTVDDVLENRRRKDAERFEEEKSQLSKPFEKEEYDKEKTLLTREQRIAQELKNARSRAEVAPISLIEWTLSNVGAQIAAVLEAIPLKIKKLMPRMTASEIEQIRREVINAQNAASKITVNLDDYYERVEHDDSPSELT